MRPRVEAYQTTRTALTSLLYIIPLIRRALLFVAIVLSIYQRSVSLMGGILLSSSIFHEFEVPRFK